MRACVCTCMQYKPEVRENIQDEDAKLRKRDRSYPFSSGVKE